MGGFQAISFAPGSSVSMDSAEIVEALNGIKSAISNTGSIAYSIGNLSASATVQSATSGTTELVTVEIPKGLYIVQVTSSYASNTNGYRLLNVLTDGEASNVRNTFVVNATQVSGIGARCEGTRLIYVENTTSLHVNVRQNSGSPLVVQAALDFIKIM